VMRLPNSYANNMTNAPLQGGRIDYTRTH